MKEGIKLVGHFAMQFRCARTGEVLHELREKNLVVNQGRTNMLRLLGGDPAGTKVAQIAVGTNSAPAATTDTTFSSPFVKNLLPTVTYGTDTVTFNYEILNSEANGLSIWEFGLCNTAGQLLTRKVLTSAINKNSSFAITGTWTLQVL